jgi:protein TonB
VRIKPTAAVETRPAEPAPLAPLAPAATVAAEPAPPPPQAAARLAATSSLDDELRSYGQLVWMQVTRRKPRTVSTSGTTVIRFALSTTGSLMMAEVVNSSGSPSLDHLALDAVQAAAPFPPPPPGAGEDRLRFTVPFHFK